MIKLRLVNNNYLNCNVNKLSNVNRFMSEYIENTYDYLHYSIGTFFNGYFSLKLFYISDLHLDYQIKKT